MTTPEDCTPRCRACLEDLEALCERSQGHLTPSGEDRRHIGRRHADDPGGLDWAAIEDGPPEEGGTGMPDWLTRWQQTDDDELLYTPQSSGTVEPREPAACCVWSNESLRQMAEERWPERVTQERWRLESVGYVVDLEVSVPAPQGSGGPP